MKKFSKAKVRAAFAALSTVLAIVLIIGLIIVFNLPENKSEHNIKYPEGVNCLEIYGIDIGQGDSTLIRIPTSNNTYYNMLIDTGLYARKDKVLALLESLNITQLNAVVATHPHADHIGSMSEIIENYEVGEFYMPSIPNNQLPNSTSFEKMLDALIEKDEKINYLKAGDSLPIEGGAAIDIIGPVGEKTYTDMNDYSIVLRVTYGSKKMIFTGDSELKAVEDIKEAGYSYRADLFKVGHHGSDNTIDKQLINEINPEIALIYCAKDNDYGHPHRETMELLEETNCEILRTDLNGDILVKCDGTQFYY